MWRVSGRIWVVESILQRILLFSLDPQPPGHAGGHARDCFRRETCEIQEVANACSLNPSGNYLQILCLRHADHSKFWGVGVDLFPGYRRGRTLLYLWWFGGVSGSKDFHHVRKITFKYIHPLFISYFSSSYIMGTWPWFAGMFYFVIKIFSLTVFWGLALFLA